MLLRKNSKLKIKAKERKPSIEKLTSRKSKAKRRLIRLRSLLKVTRPKIDLFLISLLIRVMTISINTSHAQLSTTNSV